MKYLVTGVAGFIGSKVAEYLLADGHTVVGIDNMNNYYDVRLKEHRLGFLKQQKKFDFFPVDVEHKDALEVLFMHHKFNAIINLAARAGVRYSMENPYVYMMTNAQGTLNLLELMRFHDVTKLVMASTSSLYAGQASPFSENLPVNTPISTYAASKKAAEMLCHSFHHLFDLDISILRYFTVYGPAGRPDMSIFRFIKWIDEGHEVEIFGDGQQCRDFTYVDDIARGTILAVKPLGYEIVNLGGGRRPTTINEVIQQIERHLGKKARCVFKPFHKADINETQADIRKAKTLLGWKPEVDFAVGIRNTVQWYQDNRAWLKDIAL
ncbi:MAG: SDR family NAD(P)-dependent oxidoreductase [Kiritimatiellaeota bacterium]|nr:SDR family NAD(P)-dependent oxidoreductase [Kiritimatiellota bacterium]